MKYIWINSGLVNVVIGDPASGETGNTEFISMNTGNNNTNVNDQSGETDLNADLNAQDKPK